MGSRAMLLPVDSGSSKGHLALVELPLIIFLAVYCCLEGYIRPLASHKSFVHHVQNPCRFLWTPQLRHTRAWPWARL